MYHIFISPHFDDICFSLGGYIQKLNSSDEKLIINIFTKSNYIRRMALNNIDAEKRIEIVSQIRQNEDNNFCKKYNIKQLNLDFLEQPIADNKIQIEDIQNKLSKILTEIDKNTKINIYFSLGFGDHNDHLTMFNIAINIMPIYNNFNFIFYVDLPYSHIYRVYKKRMDELRIFFNENNLKQYNYNLSFIEIKNKMKDILLYESQHNYHKYYNVKILRYFCRNKFLYISPQEIIFF